MALVERIPAENADQLAELKKTLHDLTSAEITELCGMILEPGAGDDSKARSALQALAFCAAEPSDADLRGRFNQVLAEKLQSDAAGAVKTFLIQQLQIAGDEHVVAALATMLADEEQCGPATKAMQAIGGSAARAALRQTVSTVRGPQRVAVIDALGLLHDAESVPALLSETEADDPAIRLAAIKALAAIGQPAAMETLWHATEVHSWREHSEMEDALLRYASRLAQEGYPKEAIQILRRLLEGHADRDSGHTQVAALRGLVEVLGDHAVHDVVQALASEHLEVRAAVQDIAVGLPGEETTRAFLKALSTSQPSVRAALLEVLSRRGDDAAMHAAVQALKDEDKSVRLAAVNAAAALGKEKAIDPLVEFLDGAETDDAKAAKSALVGMVGEAASSRIAESLKKPAAHVRRTLIEVLSERQAKKQLDAVYSVLSDADVSVRIAAIHAIGSLADITAVPRLLALLSPSKDNEREAIESALVATCNRGQALTPALSQGERGTALTPALSQGERESAAPILAALNIERDTDYASLLRVLGRLGGSAALDAIRIAIRDPRTEIRDAAYRSLTEWPDSQNAADLLEISDNAEDLKHHVLVFLRFADLAARVAIPLDEKLSLLDMSLQASREDSCKTFVFSKIGGLRDAKCLPLLQRYLGDVKFDDAAAAAIMQVAEGILPAEWATARQALENLITLSPTDSITQRALEALNHVAEYEDFIVDWQVSGPYFIEEKQGNEILDDVFPPEQMSATGVVWRVQPPTTDPERFWFIDLDKSVGGSHRAAYLRTRLHSPAAKEVQLELGSDDGLKVWVNGEVVLNNNALRGCGRGDDKVKVHLKAGGNDLLLKVSNAGGGWGASARVRNADGSRAADVTAKADYLDVEKPPPAPNLGKAVVQPLKPRKLLIFTLTRGYRHDSIPTGARAIQSMGETTGAYQSVISEDIRVFEPESLGQFDAVCMLNTTGELFLPPDVADLPPVERATALARDARLKKSLLDFVSGGKGLVGIHAATDCFYQWPEYGEMIGGYFDGHPWHEVVVIKLDDPQHPLNAPFNGQSLTLTDEIYQFRDPYSRERVRVLLSLDAERTPMNKPDIHRTDQDFPVSWVRTHGKGRVFYCSLGHREEIYSNPKVLRHYLAGIQFALGDLPVDTAPNRAVRTPDPGHGGAESRGTASPGSLASWQPLFNGKDLAGWKGLVENPKVRAAMTSEQLAQAQAVADERMRSHWTVDNGVLVFDGQGENICTVRDYGDFELRLDWKIEPGGDSGIYVRGSPQVQIWDPAQWPEGSGGLYNNKNNPSKPLTRADHPIGQWNTFLIKMIGDRVTVHLNDVLVVDNTILENYWEPDKPIYPRDPIELQSHGSHLYFRNLMIREIDGPPSPSGP